jgi:hypothetical protein
MRENRKGLCCGKSKANSGIPFMKTSSQKTFRKSMGRRAVANVLSTQGAVPIFFRKKSATEAGFATATNK